MELKFRYWDSVLKMMVYSDEYSYTNNLQGLESFFRNAKNYAFENNVMQWTGMYDKRSIEIYDGDIINFYFDGYNERSIVFFDRGFSVHAYNNDPGYEPFIGIVDPSDIEIIGNIYKNK